MNNKNDRAINFIRFFFLGLAIALLILLGVLAFSIYRSSTREITDADLVIVDDTEAITEQDTEIQSAAETELQTDSASEAQTDVSAAEAQTDASVNTDADTSAASSADISAETAADSSSGTDTDSSSDSSAAAAAAQSVEGDVVVIEETTASEDTSSESTGVYSTLNAACNFRSEAGYEDADGNDTTIGIYQAGTQVEVLDASGGWTKVKIDGVVGYVGAQFVGESDSDSE